MTTTSPYFTDKAAAALRGVGANHDVDPTAVASWAQAAKARDQRTGGVLVTADGRVVAEYHRDRARPVSAEYVKWEDLTRILGRSPLSNALDMACAAIRRALDEPVVALSVNTLTCGPGRR